MTGLFLVSAAVLSLVTAVFLAAVVMKDMTTMETVMNVLMISAVTGTEAGVVGASLLGVLPNPVFKIFITLFFM